MTPVDWSLADLKILVRHSTAGALERRAIAERFAVVAVIVADATLHMLTMREGGK